MLSSRLLRLHIVVVAALMFFSAAAAFAQSKPAATAITVYESPT